MGLVQVQYKRQNTFSPGRYTYEDPTDELVVGDIVEVPVVGMWGPENVLALVAELSSDYTGPVKRVIRKVTGA